MTENTMTVKEQLLEARKALAEQVKEFNFCTDQIAKSEAIVFEKAKEMADLKKLSYIFDLADSIKGYKSDIKHYDKEMKKAKKEIAKLEKEIAKLEKLDVDFDIDVVDEFLAQYRVKAEKFIRESVETNYPEAIEKLEASDRYKEAKYLERQNMMSYLNNQFGSTVVYMWGWRGSQFEDKLKAMMDYDVEMKKAVLLGRISEITGKVTDASLYIGDDGNINGHVKGEKGSAKVQTILAGGYNIQCLHYRLLVNKQK